MERITALFSTAALGQSLFPPLERYRLFAQLVFPQLVRARTELAKAYSANTGRLAVEPVLLLGVSILQYLDGVPDRGAVELLRYHAGWNFALNRQLGDELFHPTTLSKFQDRLLEHQLIAAAFSAILDGQTRAQAQRSRRRCRPSTSVAGDPAARGQGRASEVAGSVLRRAIYSDGTVRYGRAAWVKNKTIKPW